MTRATRNFRPVMPLAVLVTCAALAFALSPYAAGAIAPDDAWLAPSLKHPLGCGELGEDLLAFASSAILRVLVLAGVVSAFGFALGAPLGAFAAFVGGRFERWLDRGCDLVQAFPSFLLAMVVLSAAPKPSRVHLAFVFSISVWAPFTRLALTQGRIVRDSTFVAAASALGASRTRIVFLHLLPNVVPVAWVQFGSTAASLVVSEASLSFVGLGPSDRVSLGQLIDQGTVAMFRAPHVLFVGALALLFTSGALLLALRPQAFVHATTSSAHATGAADVRSAPSPSNA